MEKPLELNGEVATDLPESGPAANGVKTADTEPKTNGTKEEAKPAVNGTNGSAKSGGSGTSNKNVPKPQTFPVPP